MGSAKTIGALSLGDLAILPCLLLGLARDLGRFALLRVLDRATDLDLDLNLDFDLDREPRCLTLFEDTLFFFLPLVGLGLILRFKLLFFTFLDLLFFFELNADGIFFAILTCRGSNWTDNWLNGNQAILMPNSAHYYLFNSIDCFKLKLPNGEFIRINRINYNYKLN